MQETMISSMQLPVGVKFYPTDYELVCYYLLNKVLGHPLPCDIVKECDLYGDMEPWEIWERFGGYSMLESDKDLYFFTELKKKSCNGSRIERRIGSNGGTWHGEDSGKNFKAKGVDDHVYVAWTRRRFRYMNSKSKKQNGQWLMQEYSLDQSLLSAPTSTVLCRIRKNEKKKRNIDGIGYVVADQSQRSEFGLGEIDQYNKSHPQCKRLKVEEKQPQAADQIEGHIEFEENNAADHMATNGWTNDDLNELMKCTFKIDELLNDLDLKNDVEDDQTISTLEQNYATEDCDDENFDFVLPPLEDIPEYGARETLQSAFANARETDMFCNNISNCR